jgi:cytochrome c-type biogenesis protein CcmH/NrfG
MTAEATLKGLIRPDIDSTPAMAYLAVAFAASGRDTDAAAVWQTSLVDGADLPQIYEWLSQAQLRVRRVDDAREVLEEAVQKWPSDPRFTGPLAFLYALAGRPGEALAMLEKYLARAPADADALKAGVEWLYQARISGTSVRSRVEDLELARTFAAAYAKADGGEVALVTRWVAFMERDAR